MGEYNPLSIASKNNEYDLLNIDFRDKSDFMSFWKGIRFGYTIQTYLMIEILKGVVSKPLCFYLKVEII